MKCREYCGDATTLHINTQQNVKSELIPQGGGMIFSQENSIVRKVEEQQAISTATVAHRTLTAVTMIIMVSGPFSAGFTKIVQGLVFNRCGLLQFLRCSMI